MRRYLVIGIILVCGWLLSASEANAVEKRLVAVIMVNSQPRYQDIHAVFVDALQPSCGSDCRIYLQTPNSDSMSLRNSVRKAVALGAELIVTYGPSAALAAKAEVHSTPTLFADVYDPVGLKLVSAEKLTGRNITGIRGDAPLQALLKYFLDVTKAKRLAVLYDNESPEANLQRRVIQEHGAKRGVAISLLPVMDLNDPVAALERLPEGIAGLFLANSEHSDSYFEDVISFADLRQIPVLTQRSGAAEKGAFMVLETSAAEQGQKVAEMAKAVLEGKETEQMTVEKPRMVELVVNLQVAKRYNINIPFQTLSVASRVVK